MHESLDLAAVRIHSILYRLMAVCRPFYLLDVRGNGLLTLSIDVVTSHK